MKSEIHPYDIEALRRQQPVWDLNYVMSVLVKLAGQEKGCEIDFTLTPKNPEASTPGG